MKPPPTSRSFLRCLRALAATASYGSTRQSLNTVLATGAVVVTVCHNQMAKCLDREIRQRQQYLSATYIKRSANAFGEEKPCDAILS